MKNFGLLCDLDGTLVDSLSDISHVVNHVRAEYGLSTLSTGTVRAHIGKGVENLVRGTFPEIPTGRFDALLHRYREYYLEKPVSTGALYPGVRATLEALRRRGLKIAVVTNKPSLVADKTLEHYLPGFRFDLVAGPERVSERKPSPRHLLEALGPLGLKPEEACFIGDDPVDAECADAARVPFLGAGYGFGGVQVDPARMLRSFPELLEKIPFD